MHGSPGTVASPGNDAADRLASVGHQSPRFVHSVLLDDVNRWITTSIWMEPLDHRVGWKQVRTAPKGQSVVRQMVLARFSPRLKDTVPSESWAHPIRLVSFGRNNFK